MLWGLLNNNFIIDFSLESQTVLSNDNVLERRTVKIFLLTISLKKLKVLLKDTPTRLTRSHPLFFTQRIELLSVFYLTFNFINKNFKHKNHDSLHLIIWWILSADVLVSDQCLLLKRLSRTLKTVGKYGDFFSMPVYGNGEIAFKQYYEWQ